MAKLKGPLFSLGASQKLGNALVYFPWKGLNVVREYVIPSNPKTTGQTTQRGYLSAAVGFIHSAQADAAPLDETDSVAYSLWGSIFATPRTWFNQCVKNYLDQKVAAKNGQVFRNGSTTPGANKLDVEIWSHVAPAVSTGNFWVGTSKTALIRSVAAVVASHKYSQAITGLTTGVKYYWQFRPATPASALGQKSGIYYGVPT